MRLPLGEPVRFELPHGRRGVRLRPPSVRTKLLLDGGVKLAEHQLRVTQQRMVHGVFLVQVGRVYRLLHQHLARRDGVESGIFEKLAPMPKTRSASCSSWRAGSALVLASDPAASG